MPKIKILVSQLERINYPESKSPKETYIEQMLSYNDDGSYIHYYKCPCGKGRIVDEKDATPGFRTHEIIIECGECCKKYDVNYI